MTNARADESGAREVIVGISDEDLALLGGIGTDADEFVEGGQLDNCDVTIIGLKFERGGEPMKRGEEPIMRDGKQVMTSPQIVMQLRVDDIDGISDTKQYFPAPRMTTGPDGRPRFAPVNINSKLGLFLATLAGFGVADNDNLADNYRFNGWRDLLGLQFRRQHQDFPGFRQGQTIPVHVPICVYGVDNEVRKQNKLPEIKIEARGTENLTKTADGEGNTGSADSAGAAAEAETESVEA